MDAEIVDTRADMTAAALARYSPSDAAIAQMREDYMRLRVMSEDDKDGCASVRAARLTVKAHRVAVEKTRKELKEDALRYGQAVDAEARRLTAMLAPIEDHLQAQEDIVAKAAERRRLADEAARLAVLRERMTMLVQAQSSLLPEDVRGMTDEQFASSLTDARDALIARQHVEQVERDRLAAERADLARLRAEAEEAQRIKAERMARERAAFYARAAEERAAQAAESARLASERAAIEAAEDLAIQRQREADERAAADAARREAMRPANDRLRDLAVEVENLSALIPEHDASADVASILMRAATDIRAIADR